MSRANSENRSPSIGSLLRIAHSAMVLEYEKWLAASPYKDIQPAHASALQPLWQMADGMRPTELAQIARITKQSMGALVDALEEAGYVERVDDPADGRAWRVRLTARGRAFGRDVRKFSRQTEEQFEQQIGAKKLEELRSMLKLLADSFKSE